MTRTLLALALAAALSGCAVGPTHQAPTLATDAPSSWTTRLPHDGQAAQLTQWWEQFGDTTLTQLIKQAETASPTLEQASARIRQARAAAGVTDSALLPALNGSATQRRSSQDSNRQNTTSRGLDASWELDLFGGNLRASQAADARLAVAGLNWHHARVSLAAEVATTYFSLRQCEAAVELARQDVQSRTKTLELVTLKVTNGAAALPDQDRAEASAADSRSTLAAQLGTCERTRHQLAMLTAMPEERLVSLLSSPNALPPVTLAGFELLPAQVLSQRPDVAAAERQLAAASADIGVAIADMLPSLTLVGSIGINTSNASGTSVSARSWSFGPSLTLPIFDGGRRAQAVAAAHGRYDEAAGAWRQTVLTAVKEVEDALTRLNTAQQRATDASLAATRYEAYLKATEARFSAGSVSLLELEDARRLTLSARSTLLGLNLEHVQARVALYKAAGGGWSQQKTSSPQEQ